ncbi:MAG: hypothetical protein JWQ35_1111 [Bacteriovoracaceae bacterium]|nr:hypothetical protein [Bacteriovoracaceae bacterium]
MFIRFKKLFVIGLLGFCHNAWALDGHDSILEVKGYHNRNAFQFLFESLNEGTKGRRFTDLSINPNNLEPLDALKRLKPLGKFEIRIIRASIKQPDKLFKELPDPIQYLLQISNFDPITRDDTAFVPTINLLMSMNEKWKQQKAVEKNIGKIRDAANAILDMHRLQKMPETYIFQPMNNENPMHSEFAYVHLFPFHAANYLIAELNWNSLNKITIKTIDFSKISSGEAAYKRLQKFLIKTHGLEPVATVVGDPKTIEVEEYVLTSRINPERLLLLHGDAIRLSNPEFEKLNETQPSTPRIEKRHLRSICVAFFKNLFKKKG